MVVAGAVHVPVRELRLRGCPHLGNLDLEVQALAGERMIAIEGHQVASDLGDGHGPHAVPGLRLQPHPHLEVREALEGTAWHALHESLVILPVAIGRRDRHLQLVPSVLARQLALETGYEIAMAVQVRERLAPGGTVDDIAGVILQGVVDADNLVPRDAHTSPVYQSEARAPSRARKNAWANGRASKGREGYHCALPVAQPGGPRARTQGHHHHETRVPGDSRRYLPSPGPRRTQDCKDFRNGRQPVHAAEHTALRAATL